MKKILALLGILTFSSYANEDLKNIYKIFTKKFKNTKIQAVRNSPIKNLYEVVLDNGNILYTDGNYLFVGHIFDFKGQDLTQKRIDQLVGKQIDKIDLSKALKISNGKTKVIEVSDPECPFCRMAEKFFEGKDVSRYIFFMPLAFHKKARALAIHILCSDNPQEEYKKVMEGKLDKKEKLLYCKKGEERLKQMQEIVKKLKVRGVPLFFIKNTKGWERVEGVNPQKLGNLTY